MSGANRVFEMMAGFRVAARRVQKLLTALGLLALAGVLPLAFWGQLPPWAAAVAPLPLVLGLLWGFLWRWRIERAFWKGARAPRRGRPVRLPLEVILLAAAWALGGGPAAAGEARSAALIAGGRGLDAAELLLAAGPGGWIALGLGALGLLVALFLFFSLWGGHFAPRRLREELLEKMRAGDIEGARRLCQGRGNLLARCALAGLPPDGRPPRPGQDGCRVRIEAAGRRGAARWRALVGFLGAAGLLAPVAGMFGTALGLLEVFAAVAAEEASTAMVAAGAVSALLPAVVALAVSLLLLGAYYLAELRLGSLVAKCEAACMEVGAALGDLAVETAARGGPAAAAGAGSPEPEGEGAAGPEGEGESP